jgi:hypothetical protein
LGSAQWPFFFPDWNVAQTVTAMNDAITHSASGGGYTGVSIANVTANITDNDTLSVDLVVTSALITGQIGPGQRITYEVLVDNLTVGADVATAQFVFSLPPSLTNVSWICVADVGASCPPGGNGAPSHGVSLNGGTGLAYLISADVPGSALEGDDIATTATISVTTPYVDSLPGNNTDTTLDEVGPDSLFIDGFETVLPRVPYPYVPAVQ